MNTIMEATDLAVARAYEPLRSVIIRHRFNGPERYANGGYAAGTFAEGIRGAAKVILRQPIPLDRPIDLYSDGLGGLRARRGKTLLAEATPLRTPLAMPPVRSTLAQAEAASAHHGLEHVRHPLSSCYVCSPHREDGLGVTPGPLAEHPGMLAALFRVPEYEGPVPDRLAWAALDCPSYPADAFASRRLALLGTIAVEVLRSLHSDERLAVVGWTISRGIRSTVTGSALVDADGDLVAIAQSTWVDLKKRWWSR